MIISLLLLALASCAYTINQLIYNGKLKWHDDRDSYGFWGMLSYKRKYELPYVDPPNNWYYRFFKIKYKERFPGSATCFVMFTDGLHLTQHFFIISLLGAICTYTPYYSHLVNGLVYYAVWLVTFNLSYKYLSK